MYRYILFDLDGTLTDSREGIFKSIRYSLDRLGYPCPEEQTLLRFVGPPLHDSFKKYCGMDARQAKRAVEVFRERYETIGWKENHPMEGMAALMGRLKERGCKLAIASSKPERSVIPIAKLFDFMPHLDAACGSHGHNEAKKDVILEAFARLGVGTEEKKETVIVGDRKFDVEGGRMCGISCIGVEFFDFAPPGELEESGAIAVCKTVEALEKCIMEG